MAKQSIATVVLHDAHVAARAACGAAFVGAYQSICCFIAAVAITCVARRAVRADRAAKRAAAHAANKAATAIVVARKEAAEKHASRWAKRVAAKAAAAPAKRAAAKAAASVDKALKAINAARLNAVRAQRAAAKVAPVIATAKAAIAVRAQRAAAKVAPATKSPSARVPRTLKGPTVGLTIEQKVVYKAMRLGARRGATKSPTARVRLNDEAKRASITLMCMNAHAANVAKAKEEADAKAKEEAARGNLSAITMAARIAQSSAQKAANAVRKLENMINGKKTHIKKSKPITITGIISVRADNVSVAQRDSWHQMTHVTKSTKNKNAKIVDEFRTFTKIKEAKQKDAAIAKAKKWALRKEAYKNRKAAMEQIASDAWMNSGIWLSDDLIRGANDWSYQVRMAAFKEARAIAYPARKAAALVGVAA